MSIHVVDETYPHRSDAIPINIFYPSIDKMPKILVRLASPSVSSEA